MDWLVYGLTAGYTWVGLHFFAKSVGTFKELFRKGKRHPTTVLVRLKGVPEWIISSILVIATAAAGLAALAMAILWPLTLILDRVLSGD